MTFEQVTQIILVFSGLGLLVLVCRKIPALLAVPQAKTEEKKESFVLRFGKVIFKYNPLKHLSYEIFLQKLLTKIRILTLKTDSKTHGWLQQLREKTQNKFKQGNSYWEEIKKSKRK